MVSWKDAMEEEGKVIDLWVRSVDGLLLGVCAR
jgi:hypothetical protein